MPKGIHPKTEFKKGIPHGPMKKEQKENISKTCKERGIGKWLIGRKRSQLSKEKTSKTMKGKQKSMEHRLHMLGNKHGFKNGNIPWNYLDGRSKFLAPARYGDDWDKIRYLIYLRDRFTCQHCGVKNIKLHIHHKIPFLISFDNSPQNLITLCASCHRKEDAKIIKELKSKKEGEIIFCRAKLRKD